MISYADNGRIAGRDHEWVQDALSVTVEIFRSMGLETNVKNSKTIVYTSGYIWWKWGEHVYKRWVTGEG